MAIHRRRLASRCKFNEFRLLTPTFAPVRLLVCPPNIVRRREVLFARTRHQLKQDAFSRVTIGAAEKTAHWTVEHRSTLMVSTIAAIVIIAAAIGGWYYLSAQDKKPSSN